MSVIPFPRKAPTSTTDLSPRHSNALKAARDTQSAFVVLEDPDLESGVVYWLREHPCAVITIRSTDPLREKLDSLKWCVEWLEKHLTPDGTAYWDGLKMASSNDKPTRSRRKPPQLTRV